MEKRQRRSFTPEFKAETVKLVLVEKKSIPQVARDLDLTESAVRQWVKRAEIDSGKGPAGALTAAEREELSQLRKDNRELRMERELLVKWAAFFAKESK
jgi:transposase-like protein